MSSSRTDEFCSPQQTSLFNENDIYFFSVSDTECHSLKKYHSHLFTGLNIYHHISTFIK